MKSKSPRVEILMRDAASSPQTGNILPSLLTLPDADLSSVLEHGAKGLPILTGLFAPGSTPAMAAKSVLKWAS